MLKLSRPLAAAPIIPNSYHEAALGAEMIAPLWRPERRLAPMPMRKPVYAEDRSRENRDIGFGIFLSLGFTLGA